MTLSFRTRKPERRVGFRSEESHDETLRGLLWKVALQVSASWRRLRDGFTTIESVLRTFCLYDVIVLQMNRSYAANGLKIWLLFLQIWGCSRDVAWKKAP